MIRLFIALLFLPLLLSCQTPFPVYQNGSQIDLRQFGAKLDGESDDTKAFNLAIDSISRSIYLSGIYAEGELVLDGDSINWSRCNSCSINLYVSGIIKPLSTITIPSYVSVIGLGGYIGTQFGSGSSVLVKSPPTGPSIHVTGVAYTRLENLTFQYNQSSEGALTLGSENKRTGSALNWLKNINILVPGTAGAVGVKVYSNFWVWMDGFSINALDGSDAAIKFVNSKCVNGTVGGFVYMRDGIISGKHILFKSDTIPGCNAGGLGPIHLDNVHWETRRDSPMITIDTRGTEWTGLITLDELHDSDCNTNQYNCSPHIRVLGTGFTGGLRIRDCSFNLSIEGVVNELDYDAGHGVMYSSTSTVNVNGWHGADEVIRIGNEYDGGRQTQRGHTWAPQIQVASKHHPTLKNTPDELATLSSDNLEVTTGYPDPVFGNNATRIRHLSNNGLRTPIGYWRTTPPDSSIIGVTYYIKSAGNHGAGRGPEESLIIMTINGGDSLRIVRMNGRPHNYTFVSSRMSDINENGWMPVTRWYRILNPLKETKTLSVSLETRKTTDVYIYGLTVYRIDDKLNSLDRKRYANAITWQDEQAEKGMLSSPAKGLKIAGWEIKEDGIYYNGDLVIAAPNN